MGAFRMGLRQGVACLGCCWALMALAFVGGTMNLVWMGVATVLMATEKLPTLGRYVTAPLGAVLGPYEADDGLLILEVKGRSPSTPDQIALEREALRIRLLTEERSDLYRTLLIHLQNSATIDINEGLLRSSQQSG